MASIVERHGDQYIYKSPQTLDLPAVDLLTFLFDYPNDKLNDESVLHVDANDTSKFVNKARQVTLLKRLAHTLRHQYGIKDNDVVQVIFTGHYMAPTVFYGIMACGASVAASTPACTPSDLARQIHLTESKMLICSPDLRNLAKAGGSLANLPEDKVLYIGDGHEFELFEAVSGKQVEISEKEHAWRRITSKTELENTTNCYIFSSGTTGVPKAVRISHANMVAQTLMITTPMRQWYDKNIPDFEYRTIAHLPAAHISGLQSYFANQTRVGGVVYWMPRFDFVKFLEYNKKYQITTFFSVPPIYLAIAKSPLVTDQFDTLSFALTGAAALGRDIQAAAQAKFGKGSGSLSQTWGLSETTGGFTLLPKGEIDDTGSVSMILPNCMARLVGEDGKDVEPGQSGEMWVRGPIVTKGYFKNEEANREAFVDGWFRTGDNLSFQDGRFYFVDRKKELIKYNGIQVAPAELEALLVTHPKIQDAAVIGVEGEGTELPRAYVVADRASLSAQDIMNWVAGKVASYKRLRGGVIFINAIPKSPAGKILRKELRLLAKKEHSPKL